MSATFSNDSTIPNLLSLVLSQGWPPDELDELVHEAAGALAASINNGGLPQQIAFLVEQLGEADVRERLSARANDETAGSHDGSYYVLHHRWDLNCQTVYHLPSRQAAERKILNIMAADLPHLIDTDAAEIAQAMITGDFQQAAARWHAAQGQHDTVDFGPVCVCEANEEMPDLSEFISG